MLVIGQVDSITGAGRAGLIKTEFRIIQIEKSGGWNGNGIFTYQNSPPLL